MVLIYNSDYVLMINNRLLAGTLALVLIAGMSTPAFGQTSFTTGGTSTPSEIFIPQHGSAGASFTGPFNELGGGFESTQQVTGQTFTATTDCLIGVDLFLFEFFGGTSETVTVTIRDVDLFGVVLGTPTIMQVNLNAGTTLQNPDVVHFDFSSIPLVVGQTYGIQFEEPAGDPIFSAGTTFGNPYAGGSAFQSNAEFPDLDIGFVTYCDDVVGGEFLPIDSTALILAGAQTFSWMIPVVLSVLGIGLFVVSRKSE